MLGRRTGAAALLALGTYLALAVSAHAQSIDNTCDQVSPNAAACIGMDKLAETAAAECSQAGLPNSDCTLPLGHHLSAQIVSAYHGGWLHRAAAFQYRLGNGLPLVSTQWLGTHNSFNSVRDSLTLSHMDSNQQLTLTQQLDIDMRSLELDVHFVPSVETDGSKAVVVCHGESPSQENFGCTNEPRLVHVLPEIATWLNAHRDQVVLLYLEDELGDPAGYTQTVSALDSILRHPDGSSMIYRPSGSEMTAKGCANLPLGISRDDVLGRGAQVVLVGNCRSGWAPDVYSWDDNHVESGSTPDYRPFPACDSTYPRSVYNAKLVRYYEDSTFLSAAADPTESPSQAQAGMLTPAHVAEMTGCGVNLFGFDQILPDDGRIEASIWSWAKDQPNADAGSCALQRADGRWVTAPCAERHPAACSSSTGWTVTHPVAFAGARSACRSRGAGFDLPRTGYDNSLLREAAGSSPVWIEYELP
jgi:hypothetical protein